MIHKPINNTLVRELKNNITKHCNDVSKDRVMGLWQEKMVAMKREIFENADINGFLNFPTISATMFVGNCPSVGKEYDILMSSPQVFKWMNAIQENTIGSPRISDVNPNSSGNLIHNVYHLNVFEDNTKEQIENMDMIVEFGGGYGSMCRAIYQAGFKGKYVLYDLPVFACIQNFYLKSLEYNVSDMNVVSNNGDISCFFDTNKLGEQMNVNRGLKNKMFIATWSLSESPLLIRNIIIDLLKMHGFNYFLIASMTHWEGIDNIRFFSELDIPGVEFKVIQNEFFIPNFYVIGYPK